MSEVIVSVEHGVLHDCMINYEPDHPQCVTLVLMSENGMLRRVISTLDHAVKSFIVVDGPILKVPQMSEQLDEFGNPLVRKSYHLGDQPPAVLFYDVTRDEQRSITQEDVDAFSKFVGWNLEMREIVSALTGSGASIRFTRTQLSRAKEVLGL